MKVLMINSVCGIRSTGRICTDLAQTFEAQGHICKIAYGRETVPEKYRKYAVRIGSDTDVKLHGIYSRMFDRHGFGSRGATKKFIKWVKEFDPDVIHLHNLHGYYINIEVLFDYLKEAEKPVVWTLHDCWAFTGHCTNLIGCDKWKTGCVKCTKFRNYPRSFWDGSKRNFAKKKQLISAVENMTVITPSNWLAELTKQSFLGKFPVEVINNGIDVNIFKPTIGDFRNKYGLENKKIVLGVASAWSDSKGLCDFIKLADILDDNYKIVLVGLTEAQIKDIPDSIIGIAKTNSTTELAEIYTAADVFLNLTYNDNYPTVNLEAQACGTPVITYRTGGSPEALDESWGLIFAPGDISSVSKALMSMKNKAYYTEKCIEHSRAFDKKRMCDNYIDLYQK